MPPRKADWARAHRTPATPALPPASAAFPGLSAPSPLEGAASGPTAPGRYSQARPFTADQASPGEAPASPGPFQSSGLKPAALCRPDLVQVPSTLNFTEGPMLSPPTQPSENPRVLRLPFYKLGPKEGNSHAQGDTANVWQNEMPRGPGSDLLASGVLPQRVSNPLTVAFYPGGKTEAQGSAR